MKDTKCNNKIESFYEFAELMAEINKLTLPELAYNFGKAARH